LKIRTQVFKLIYKKLLLQLLLLLLYAIIQTFLDHIHYTIKHTESSKIIHFVLNWFWQNYANYIPRGRIL